MLKQVARAAAVYGGADLVGRLIAFAALPIYAHSFSVRELGVLNLLLTTVGLLGIASNLGINNSVQRFYFDHRSGGLDHRALVTTGLALLTVWSAGIAALAVLAGLILGEQLNAHFGISLELLVLAVALTVVSQPQLYTMDVLRLHFRPWQVGYLSLLRNGGGTLLGLALILAAGLDLSGYFWGHLVAALIVLPIGLFAIRSALSRDLQLAETRQLVEFGYPFVLAGFANWVMASVAIWMVSHSGDAVGTGWYGIAMQLGSVLMFAINAFGQAWLPQAMKAYADTSDYRESFARVFGYWIFGLALMAGGAALFSSELLRLLAPPDYWPAARVFSIMAPGLALLGTTQVTYLGLALEKRSDLIATQAWIAAAVTIVGCLLLLPHWGPVGGAFASTVAYATLTVLYGYHSQRLHPLPVRFRQLIIPTVAFVTVTAVGAYLSDRDPTPALIIIKMLLLCALFASGVIGGLIRAEDLRRVLGRP